jgi:hypothetical protein
VSVVPVEIVLPDSATDNVPLPEASVVSVPTVVPPTITVNDELADAPVT